MNKYLESLYSKALPRETYWGKFTGTIPLLCKLSFVEGMEGFFYNLILLCHETCIVGSTHCNSQNFSETTTNLQLCEFCMGPNQLLKSENISIPLYLPELFNFR